MKRREQRAKAERENKLLRTRQVAFCNIASNVKRQQLSAAVKLLWQVPHCMPNIPLLTSSTLSPQPYLHESRHKHASKRQRGGGGRFMSAKEKADAAAAAGGDGDGDSGAAISNGSSGEVGVAGGTMSGPQPDDPASAAAAASAAPGTLVEADDLPRLPQLAPKTTLPAMAGFAALVSQLGQRTLARGRQPEAGGLATEAAGGGASSQQLVQVAAQLKGVCATTQSLPQLQQQLPPMAGRRQQLQQAPKAKAAGADGEQGLGLLGCS